MKRRLMTVLTMFLPLIAGGCGDVHQGPSPTLVRIKQLEAASGATPAAFGGTLLSDVVTLVVRPADQGGNYFSSYNDLARVTMDIALKDPGAPGITNVVGDLNAVTFTRYHVKFVRSDGHNIEGVDVPYAFDGGVTFTVAGTVSSQATFELVHHTAKDEAPLKALATNGEIINTIAQITFYGQDGAGNNVSVMGQISVMFGDFADPKV